MPLRAFQIRVHSKLITHYGVLGGLGTMGEAEHGKSTALDQEGHPLTTHFTGTGHVDRTWINRKATKALTDRIYRPWCSSMLFVSLAGIAGECASMPRQRRKIAKSKPSCTRCCTQMTSLSVPGLCKEGSRLKGFGFRLPTHPHKVLASPLLQLGAGLQLQHRGRRRGPSAPCPPWHRRVP
jgi:hypothetical protein